MARTCTPRVSPLDPALFPVGLHDLLPRLAQHAVVVDGALLLLELLLNVFLLGALCADPDSNSDRCAATVLLPPFAGVLSPLVGLAFLLRVMLVQLRAADGADAATRELSVGAPGRLLHTLALWNACSTVNALVALPFAASLPPAYLSPVPPVVLPLALVATKLVSAQAIKGLATSVGLTPAAWSLLDVIEEGGHARDRRVLGEGHVGVGVIGGARKPHEVRERELWQEHHSRRH